MVTVVAVACGYVLHEYRVVRERSAMVGAVGNCHCITISSGPPNWGPGFSDGKIPWLRQRLGDLQYEAIAVGNDASEELMDRYRTAFPEAKVVKNNDDEVFGAFRFFSGPAR